MKLQEQSGFLTRTPLKQPAIVSFTTFGRTAEARAKLGSWLDTYLVRGSAARP